MIEFFIISLMCSFGLAVILVEKSEDWPVNIITSKIKGILGLFNNNLPNMLECTTCTSFWASLVVDIILYLFFGYFFWPLSGFATAGFTWFIMEFLNAIDKPDEDITKDPAISALGDVIDNINNAYQEKENQTEE
tara:strand:- start:2636 stop:3040 length:405 start_codon:yes stop_codon:yes gene_type:complete